MVDHVFDMFQQELHIMEIKPKHCQYQTNCVYSSLWNYVYIYMFSTVFWKSLNSITLDLMPGLFGSALHSTFLSVLHILRKEGGINISSLISQASYSGRKTVWQYKFNTMRHESWKSAFYLPHKKKKIYPNVRDLNKLTTLKFHRANWHSQRCPKWYWFFKMFLVLNIWFVGLRACRGIIFA